MPFNPEQLVERLVAVKPSSETIKTLSRSMMLRRKRAHEAAEAWTKAVMKARPEQALWLLWVANDAMQLAHSKRATSMVDALRAALPVALERIAVEDSASTPKARRVLSVLVERGVVDEAAGAALQRTLEDKLADADNRVVESAYTAQVHFEVPEAELQGAALADHAALHGTAAARFCDTTIRDLRRRADALKNRYAPLVERPDAVSGQGDEAVRAAREAVTVLADLRAARRSAADTKRRAAAAVRDAVEEERGKLSRDEGVLARCMEAEAAVEALAESAQGADVVVRFCAPQEAGDGDDGSASGEDQAAGSSAGGAATDEWDVPLEGGTPVQRLRPDAVEEEDGASLAAALRTGLQGTGDEADDALADSLAVGGGDQPPAKRARGAGGHGTGGEGAATEQPQQERGREVEDEEEEEEEEVPMVWSVEAGRMVPANL